MKQKAESPLRQFLYHGPATWATIRAVECELLLKIPLGLRVLDVGCGDGEFAKVFSKFKGGKKFMWGIDRSWSEVEKARKTGIYRQVLVGDVRQLPFKSGEVGTVFSNGALEHVEGVDKALSEISRVLRKGGKLVFTVPSAYFSGYLFFSKLFKRLGWIFLAEWYEKWFNSLFKHKNLFNHQEWINRLAKRRFKVTDYWYYNNPRQVAWCDLLTWLAMPAFLNKLIWGKWVVWGWERKWTAAIAERLVKKFYTTATSKKAGGSLLVIARKE